MAFQQKYSHLVQFYSHFTVAFSQRQRQQAPEFDHINVISMASLHYIFGALSLLSDSYESFPFCNTTTFFGKRCFKPDLFPLGMNTSYKQAETRSVCNESEKFSQADFD